MKRFLEPSPCKVEVRKGCGLLELKVSYDKIRNLPRANVKEYYRYVRENK
jgi:hypothetical protein